MKNNNISQKYTPHQMMEIAQKGIQALEMTGLKDLAAVRTILKDHKLLSGFASVPSQAKEHETLIAWLADMSGGKSSIINAILGYPLLPVAKKTTSSCPVEIRYGSPMLKVFAYRYEDDAKSLIGRELFCFRRAGDLSTTVKQRLLSYVVHLTRKNVLHCQNLDYLYDAYTVMDGDCSFIYNSEPMLMQLMLILLNAYIGQDDCDLAQQRSELIAERSRLLKEVFGISDPSKPYGVSAWMEADALRGGTVLVDLPGLGSGNMLHTRITKHYMQYVDSFVLSFDASAHVSEVNDALALLLSMEKMRTGSRDSRFVVILNKCDQCYEESPRRYGGELAQAASDIAPLLKDIQVPVIYPISARYGDYRMLSSGVSPRNTPKGEKMDGCTDEEIAEALKKDYQFAFTYPGPDGKQVSCSTEQFIEEIVAGRAPRMQTLNSFVGMNAKMNQWDLLLSDLNLRRTMLSITQGCGDDMMDQLVKGMDEALDGVKDHVAAAVDQACGAQQERACELSDALSDACQAFNAGILEGQQVISDYVNRLADTLETNWWGDTIVEGKKGKNARNADTFEKICRYVKDFSFQPYLQRGLNLMEMQFEAERRSFRNCISDLEDALEKNIAHTGRALSQVYDRIAKCAAFSSQSEEIKTLYRDCFMQARDEILRQLESLSHQIIRDMRADSSLEDEISETVSELMSAIGDLSNHYKHECSRCVDAVSDYTFWRTKSRVNPHELKKQIADPLVRRDEDVWNAARLNRMLTDANSRFSHASRMDRAVEGVMSRAQAELTRAIAHIGPAICGSVADDFERSGENLRERFQVLDKAVKAAVHTVEEAAKADSPVMIACRAALTADWAQAAGKELMDRLAAGLTEWTKLEAALHNHLK